MTIRSYSLFDTPLDLNASFDELIRNYELVRCNAKQIAPFLTSNCEFDVLASGSAHNPGKIPVLGLHCSDDTLTYDIDQIQKAIDTWFKTKSTDAVRQMKDELIAPTWKDLELIGSHPVRN